MSRRAIQDPEAQPSRMPGNDGGTRYTHPAYGSIVANRTSGSAVLFGSDFEHQHFVTIVVRRSELERSLSNDWHFPKEELIEVRLTEAQWATFVSSMNVGSGVPCTLTRVNGQSVPGFPLRVEDDEFRSELNGKTDGLIALVDAAIKKINDEASGLSKVKRDRLVAELSGLRRTLSSSLPFIVHQHGEYMERTVEKAKIEVNAYVTSAITRAGLQALSEGEPPLLRLGRVDDVAEGDFEVLPPEAAGGQEFPG